MVLTETANKLSQSLRGLIHRCRMYTVIMVKLKRFSVAFVDIIVFFNWFKRELRTENLEILFFSIIVFSGIPT